MRLLKAGVDTSVIALWPGHESIETTREFADLHLKKRALDRTRPLASPTGPIPTPDYILTWLDAL